MSKKIIPAFLHEKEAATYLNMSVNWLRKCRGNDTGPNWYKFGGSVRYAISDLDDYIDQSRGGYPPAPA